MEKPIKYLNYDIYRDGSVFSYYTNKWLLVNEQGTINLMMGKKKSTHYRLARLVYEKFVGELGENEHIIFKDKYAKNKYSVDNLIKKTIGTGQSTTTKNLEAK